MLIKLSKCSITNYNVFKFVDIQFNTNIVLLSICGFEQHMANLNKHPFILNNQPQ